MYDRLRANREAYATGPRFMRIKRYASRSSASGRFYIASRPRSNALSLAFTRSLGAKSRRLVVFRPMLALSKTIRFPYAQPLTSKQCEASPLGLALELSRS